MIYMRALQAHSQRIGVRRKMFLYRIDQCCKAKIFNIYIYICVHYGANFATSIGAKPRCEFI